MNPLPYRNDVDGLRAIAVLFVLLFHLGFGWIPGGFVGVDIFFVISGFVIFRNLIADLEEGKFSPYNFYRRRLLRILPALLLTNILVIAAGAIMLTPTEFQQLSATSLASVFSVSNIYFADKLEYFSASAKTMPLIHTWSLGVEEQFYITLPIAVLFVARRFGPRGIYVMAVSVCLVSFLCNIGTIYLLNNEKLAFYLPFSRFWEIGVGAVAAFWERGFALSRRAASILVALGFAGLAASATIIDDSAYFPGWSAILPIASAALLILAVPAAQGWVYRALGCRVLVFFGSISYSLYLFHWPIIAYYKLYVGRGLTVAEAVLLFCLTVLAACLSWKFIETPFRRARAGEAWLQARRIILVSLLACVTAGGTIMLNDGLPVRMRAEALTILRANEKLADHERACRPFPRARAIDRAIVCSFSEGPGKRHYLLWGDSHAGMYARGLAANLAPRGLRGVVASMPDCPPLLGIHTSKRKNRRQCAKLGEEILRLVRAERLPVVVLAGRWANLGSTERAPGDGERAKSLYDSGNGGGPIEFEGALLATLRRLQGAGARIVIIGPAPEIDFHVPEMLVRTANLGKAMPVAERAAFEIRQDLVLRALKKAARIDGVSVTYPHRALCDARACRVEIGRTPLYVDDDHLSPAGIRLVLPPISRAVAAQIRSARN